MLSFEFFDFNPLAKFRLKIQLKTQKSKINMFIDVYLELKTQRINPKIFFAFGERKPPSLK
jgi:hypothetical protein